jgi:hypothetical protein
MASGQRKFKISGKKRGGRKNPLLSWGETTAGRSENEITSCQTLKIEAKLDGGAVLDEVFPCLRGGVFGHRGLRVFGRKFRRVTSISGNSWKLFACFGKGGILSWFRHFAKSKNR